MIEKTKKLTKEQYEKYCKGEIKFCDLLKRLNLTRNELETEFKLLGYKHRRNVLQETTKHDFFDKIDSERKAYLLGFYLADGWISNNRLSIGVNENDKEIVELFQTAISPFSQIFYLKEKINTKTNYITKPMYCISIFSRKICEKLNEYGIGNNKTFSSNFDFNIIPTELMIHFIRGYFDGDGVVCVTNGVRSQKNKLYPYTNYNWSILSNRKENVLPIQLFLLNEYNINSNILNDGRGHYLIEINKKEDFFNMRDLLYNNATFFLQRKKDKYYAIKKTPNRKKKIAKYYNGTIVKTFNSLKEAGKEENMTGSGITVRIKNKLNVNGYTWAYYDSNTQNQ